MKPFFIRENKPIKKNYNDFEMKISHCYRIKISYMLCLINFRNKRNNIWIHTREDPTLPKELLDNFTNINNNNISKRVINPSRLGALSPLSGKNHMLHFIKIMAFNKKIIFIINNKRRNIKSNKRLHRSK